MLIKNLYRKLFNNWFDEYQNDTRHGLKGKLIISDVVHIGDIKAFNDFKDK